MGLFGSKKSKTIRKNAEWKQGLIHTVVELEEDHLKLVTPTATDTIFYKDIVSVEVSVNVVNIRTNVKTFSLIARGLRGAGDRAQGLHDELVERMSMNKW